MFRLSIFALLLALGCTGGQGDDCYPNHTCDQDLICVWGWRSSSGNLYPGVCIPSGDIHLQDFKFRSPEECVCPRCPDAGRATWR